MKFTIEQVAICPPRSDKAIALLQALGLVTWTHDRVEAVGQVHGRPEANVANLAFNYEAGGFGAPLEFEVLEYVDGANWMQQRAPSVSHFGMHCTEEELEQWKSKMSELGISIVQEVRTHRHTNPAIAGTRTYHYTIFDTRRVLGVDLKFIVREAV